MIRLIAALMLIATPAAAGIDAPPIVSQSVKVNGVAPDVNGNIALPMPTPSGSIPSNETIGGAVGASAAYMRADAQIPRISRAGSCVLNASGVCTITWVSPLSVAPNIILQPISSGSMPVSCNVTAAPTTTTVSVRCWTAQTVTVSILGAVVAPFTTAASGITVQATAIPPTQ